MTGRGVDSFEVESLPLRVLFGWGSSTSRLLHEIERLGARKVLVICTEQETALAAALAEPLGELVCGVFSEVRPHVPGEIVERAVQRAWGLGADALLSIGGGSTTGTAKAIALRMALPIVAVPTTYAGSEVTPVWGTTEDGRKVTGRSPLVLPRTVIYDPVHTMTLPAGLTATSGMNAMAHCIEAFYAPGANPVTELVATEGVRALAAGLPVVVADVGDEKGRALMLYGAYLAGSAFATAGSGLHHKICHVLGGAFDLPHAETHAVVLPHVAAFNEPAVDALRTRAAPALEASSVADGLLRLVSDIGAPTALQDIGMSRNDLDQAVKLVLDKDLSDNPRPVHSEDVRRILDDAFCGNAPDRNVSWLSADLPTPVPDSRERL